VRIYGDGRALLSSGLGPSRSGSGSLQQHTSESQRRTTSPRSTRQPYSAQVILVAYFAALNHNRPVAREGESYEIRPFPKIRRAYVDVLREGHRRHIIHGLVEVDISKARILIASEERGPLSFTGFITACVGKAVDENRMLHAHRWGRRKLVLFDDVDVNMQLEEVQADGTRIVQSRIIRAVNRKTVMEISAKIRQAQEVTDVDRRRYRGTLWLVSLPRMIRRLVWRLMMARPWWTKRFGGTVAVSAIGMFGTNLGWGIPITPTPLMVTVGGIGTRPVLNDGKIENREHLSLTISVDHDIIDGAPAARFVERLRELIENGHGLEG
jgi:pyruvate/2-oxoglutarate dehydrogenase complex dihydrolipoamide acyltransferase (E2) component